MSVRIFRIGGAPRAPFDASLLRLLRAVSTALFFGLLGGAASSICSAFQVIWNDMPCWRLTMSSRLRLQSRTGADILAGWMRDFASIPTCFTELERLRVHESQDDRYGRKRLAGATCRAQGLFACVSAAVQRGHGPCGRDGDLSRWRRSAKRPRPAETHRHPLRRRIDASHDAADAGRFMATAPEGRE